ILRQPLLQRWRQHQKLIRLVRSKRLRHGTLSQASSGARNLQAYAASQHPFRRRAGGLLGQAPSCVEATTIHLRQSGWNETKHYHGFWDWCGPVQEFRVFEEMTSAWRNKYVRTSNLPPGTPAEEHFY